MPEDDNIIAANPTKRFFIDMLTRDLTTADCILDLIDNAIDKAVDTSGVDVMRLLTNGAQTPHFEGVSVSLSVSPDEFVIQDTCGGIGIDEARQKVFLLGTPNEGDTPGTEPAGLSVYGIGMKRAFFKLGNNIRMESTTPTESFAVDIDVNEWKNSEGWTFAFASQSTLAHEQSTPAGTIIRVSELWEGVKTRFAQASFMSELRKKVAITYSLFVEAGLKIYINQQSVDSALPQLGTGTGVTTARKMITADDVDILIIAGVTARDDETPRGWYVFCNGRMVVEADRTELTGWGTLVPKWHVKYGHFVGYVYFRSTNLLNLPWTTTKRGIVLESPIYQTALSEMQVQSRPVLTFLSNLYPTDIEPEGIAERELFQKTTSIPIDELDRADATFHVDIPRPRARAEDKLVNIQYKKRKKDIDRIKACSNDLRWASARKIGDYTFDYFIKQECEP